MVSTLRFFEKKDLVKIMDRAIELLSTLGVKIQDKSICNFLIENGAKMDTSSERILLDQSTIEKAVKTIPNQFKLYDRNGNCTHTFGEKRTYFAPGSAAIDIFDLNLNAHRKPVTADYKSYVRIVEQLPFIHAQSTAFIPTDVPNEIADSYRLFLSLLVGTKPVVTGAFKADSIQLMTDLQLIIRGSSSNLNEKPLAVFSCCPSSPLKWSTDTAQNIVDCAQNDIPIELIAMPLSGFLAPVTLFETVIQHTAETLSGIVISQLTKPGAPLLYGGSPAVFDMRYQTTPMGAIETMMIICAYNEVGKYLNIPTQAYISLSDSKDPDMQAGFETGMGAILAVLSGIDNVSGPGMIDFESSFSPEKLIVDNEICRMAQRLKEGITDHQDHSFPELFEELITEGHLLASEHTQLFLRSEHLIPGPVINRDNRENWIDQGAASLLNRARMEKEKLLKQDPEHTLDDSIQSELIERMQAEARKYGMERLP